MVRDQVEDWGKTQLEQIKMGTFCRVDVSLDKTKDKAISKLENLERRS